MKGGDGVTSLSSASLALIKNLISRNVSMWDTLLLSDQLDWLVPINFTVVLIKNAHFAAYLQHI